MVDFAVITVVISGGELGFWFIVSPFVGIVNVQKKNDLDFCWDMVLCFLYILNKVTQMS